MGAGYRGLKQTTSLSYGGLTSGAGTNVIQVGSASAPIGQKLESSATETLTGSHVCGLIGGSIKHCMQYLQGRREVLVADAKAELA